MLMGLSRKLRHDSGKAGLLHGIQRAREREREREEREREEREREGERERERERGRRCVHLGR